MQQIECAQIARQSAAGRSTADILGQLVPALAPASGTTSNYGMTMRGRSVQVLIDGVPLTGSRDGARQLNSISPAMIERIEVVSGASNLYGAGATGGVVNIITRHAGDEPSAFSSGIGLRSAHHPGSDNLAWHFAQTASFQSAHVGGFLGVSGSMQGERQDARSQRIGPEIAQTDRQDTRTIDLNSRLDWRWGEGRHLNFGLRHYDDHQDSGYGPDYGPNLAALLVPGFEPSRRAVPGLRLAEQPRTRHDAANIQYQHAHLPGGQHLSAQAYWREETARWFPSVAMAAHPLLPPGFPVVLQSQTRIEVQGLRSTLQKDLMLHGRTLQLNYGLDHERERDRQSGQTYDVNAFIASNGLDYRKTARHAMARRCGSARPGCSCKPMWRLRHAGMCRRACAGSTSTTTLPNPSRSARSSSPTLRPAIGYRHWQAAGCGTARSCPMSARSSVTAPGSRCLPVFARFQPARHPAHAARCRG